MKINNLEWRANRKPQVNFRFNKLKEFFVVLHDKTTGDVVGETVRAYDKVSATNLVHDNYHSNIKVAAIYEC